MRSYSPVGPLVPEKRRGALLSIRLWTLGMPVRPVLFDAAFSAAGALTERHGSRRALNLAYVDTARSGRFRHRRRIPLWAFGGSTGGVHSEIGCLAGPAGRQNMSGYNLLWSRANSIGNDFSCTHLAGAI